MKDRIFSACKLILKSIILLIAGGIVGVLLLMAAYALPLNEEKAAVSLAQSEEMDGGYPLVNKHTTYVSHFNSYEPGVLDDSTDLIILSKVFDTGSKSLLKRAVYMNGYLRYWHGYVAVLRPLLNLMTYWDFRLLNGMLQISLIVLLAFLIRSRTGRWRYVLALLTSYALLMPSALGMSLQFSPSFYLSFLGVLFVVCKSDFLLEKFQYYYFFLILGMLICYFDFLTYPLVTWAFPICWLLVVAGDKLSVRGKFGIVIVSGISWFVGYAGFFLMKWNIAKLCGYKKAVMSSFGSASVRYGGLDDYMQTYVQTYNRFEALYTNWRHYQFIGYAVILLAWILWAWFYFLRDQWKTKPGIAAFALICFSSPAWYLVLANHTATHHFFTYRLYGCSILAFVLFLCECCAVKEKAPFAWRTFAGRLAVIAVTLGAGWGLSFFAKENDNSFYGGERQELVLRENDRYEVEFFPKYDNVKRLGFCVRTDDAAGYYRVEVKTGEEVCYQVDVPLTKHENYPYYQEAVDWYFDRDKSYVICITPHDINGEIALLLTLEGDRPLTEFGGHALNGEPLSDGIEPLGGIDYHFSVRAIPTKLYLAALCAAFLIALGWGGYSEGRTRAGF